MTAERIVQEPEHVSRTILVGLAMIVVGVALFVAQWQDWEIRWWSTWWTLLVFFIGLARFIAPVSEQGCPRSRRTGVWLMVIGVWGFISESRLFGLSYASSWPLLVIMGGVSIVWKAIEAPQPPSRGAAREN